MVSLEKETFYKNLNERDDNRRLSHSFIIPARTGKGFVVKQGQILRVIAIDGPQVADLNAFNLSNPKEMFWSGRTRRFEKAHLTVGNQLWSTPPHVRPMLTIVRDTVDHQPLPFGAASHDVLLSRCAERVYELREGKLNHPNCQDNLAKGIEEFNLTPDYVHDAFNIFMVTGIDDEDKMFYLDSDSKKGDYVDLFAEMDCIISISACPGGCSGPESLPIGIEIYDVIS